MVISESLPVAERLRKTWQFQRVYRQGKRLRGSCFTIISAPNDEGRNRLGISVYGFKSAVARNRVKRIIREFYRRNKELVASCLPAVIPVASSDIVFTVRRQFGLETSAQMADEVRILAERMQSGRRAGRSQSQCEKTG